MSRTDEHVIVVGVGGSPASAGALRWAVDEARRRQARLRVICSWDPEFPACSQAGHPLSPVQQRAAASETLGGLLRTEFGDILPNEVSAELVAGVAEQVLVKRAAGADLLVLGAATPPWGRGRSAGPVLRACLSRARCPVVTVCAEAGPQYHDDGDRRAARV